MAPGKAGVTKALALAVGLAVSASIVEAEQNLLTTSQISSSYGVVREQRLVDGKLPHPQAPVNDFVATLFLEATAFVEFGFDRPTALAAIQLVSADDAIEIEVSTGGSRYRLYPLEPKGRVGPMQVFVGDEPVEGVRQVRLSMRPGRERGAVGEVLAFAVEPQSLPVVLELQDPPTYRATVERILVRDRWVSRALFLLAAGAIPVLLFASRSQPRQQWVLCLFVVVLAFLGWIRLGQFLGGGRVLHSWDQTHYYLGAKYFPELGYRELYRCLAAWERQQGRGFLVDGVRIRDLDSNETRQGTWTASEAGRCRAEFSPTRWQDFGTDADHLRRSFRFRRLHDILKDHGYNATPFASMLLGSLADALPARRAPLVALGALDALALAGVVAVLWWAFGPVAAAAAALVIGFGDPWAYSWTGGSLGRHLWLFGLSAGLALIHKRRWLEGSALLTMAGLLRLFPLVLLTGLVLHAVQGVYSRSDRRRLRPICVGIAVMLVIGVALPAILYGGDVWLDFFDNAMGHGKVPSINFMGLGPIVSAGLEHSALSPSAEGESHLLRRFLWLAGFLAALAWLAWVLRKHSQAWMTIPLSAPLLFCSIPLSSYDFVWLVVIAPFMTLHRWGLLALLGFVAASNLVGEVLPEGRTMYLVFSVGIAVVLGILSWEASRSASVGDSWGADRRRLVAGD